jgi:outer membrane protein
VRRSRARPCAACWLVAACCVAGPKAAAQARIEAAAESGGLSLEDVLRTTLHDNPDIRVAARRADAERGVLVGAGDPFDAKLQTGFGSNRSFNTLQPGATGSQYFWIDTRQTQYSVGLQKQLRQGMTVSPELDVSRTATPTLPGLPAGQATARLKLLVPLLNDRNGLVTTAPERAAQRAYEASKFQTQHVTAQSILSATTAYWDYQAATASILVLTDSEARAQRLVADTRLLVEAGERPPSDLTQVRGNLAAKRVARLSAEQAVIDARVRLGLVMGLGPTETAAMGQATTPFPAADTLETDAIATPALVDEALDHRPDLRALDKSVESARVTLGAARDNLKPRVDLVTSVGYAGLQVGGGVTSLISPVYRNVPGADLSISFQYQRPTANVGARGRLLQADSAYEEERIAQQDLQRQIRTGVYQASESIARNAASVTEAHEAVALYQATVRSEERKFQLGVSTLFDTILAADALTTVALSEISAQREYAVAVAALRFETGTLVAADSQGGTVDVARLLNPR